MLSLERAHDNSSLLLIKLSELLGFPLEISLEGLNQLSNDISLTLFDQCLADPSEALVELSQVLSRMQTTTRFTFRSAEWRRLGEDDHQVVEKASSLAEVELLHLQFGLLKQLPEFGVGLLAVLIQAGGEVIQLWPLRILGATHQAELTHLPRLAVLLHCCQPCLNLGFHLVYPPLK